MAKDEVEITVRQIMEDDIDGVLAFGGDLISGEDLLAFELGAPLDVSFVAEAKGRVIGFILARIHYIGIPLAKVCVIGGIVVDHEYRRRRIGNRLVEELFASCREKGVYTVRSLIEGSDSELQDFTEQLGFYRSTIVNYDNIL